MIAGSSACFEPVLLPLEVLSARGGGNQSSPQKTKHRAGTCRNLPIPKGDDKQTPCLAIPTRHYLCNPFFHQNISRADAGKAEFQFSHCIHEKNMV